MRDRHGPLLGPCPVCPADIRDNVPQCPVRPALARRENKAMGDDIDDVDDVVRAWSAGPEHALSRLPKQRKVPVLKCLLQKLEKSAVNIARVTPPPTKRRYRKRNVATSN